jgi:choline dehydrogenase-like flavoprotein
VTATYGKTEYDWNFLSVPQQTLNGRQINQARGKILGCSSALNFMMLLYPNRAIIDAWASIGNDGWSFDSLAPYFRKIATAHAPPQATKDVVGLTYHDMSVEDGNGPIQVSFSEGYGVTNDAWFKSFSALGLEINTDPRKKKKLATPKPDVCVCEKVQGDQQDAPESFVNRAMFEVSDGDVPRAIGVDEAGNKAQVLMNSEVILARGGASDSPDPRVFWHRRCIAAEGTRYRFDDREPERWREHARPRHRLPGFRGQQWYPFRRCLARSAGSPGVDSDVPG